MERVRPVVVLACLVLVVGAVPAPGGSATAAGGADEPRTAATAPPYPLENTTARLALPHYRVTQDEFETVHLEMGGSLQLGADSARDEHERLAIERKFETAESIDEKRSVIDGALRNLENRAQTLEARERRAIREYSDGNITAAMLVRELARIDASARQVRKTLVTLRRLTDRTGIDRFDVRIRDVDGHVEHLRGPVRQRTARTLAGEASGTRIHVTASARGVVLSMLTDGQYVREATKWSNRNASARDELTITSVGSRIEELYPWASEVGGPDIQWRGNGVWRFRTTHPQGELTAYVDAGTREVFREVQRLQVEDMPKTMVVDRTGNGLRVVLERTYVGGPLHVVVEDAGTGAAVNARVTVDGHELGHTGADGRVRTIEPRPGYDVNVTHEGSSLAIEVERPFEESGD